MRHFPRHQDDVSEYLLCSQNQNDVHNNQYQKRNKKQTPPPKKNPRTTKTQRKLLSCILWWWPSPHFSPQCPLQPWDFTAPGKAASFILGNITINQKLLIWQDVVGKEGSLYFPGLKPLWQKVILLFLRGKEIQSYRSWHLGWRGHRHRWTGWKPCAEQQRLVSTGKRRKKSL